jgi:hypothetical protein
MAGSHPLVIESPPQVRAQKYLPFITKASKAHRDTNQSQNTQISEFTNLKCKVHHELIVTMVHHHHHHSIKP